MRRKKQGNSKNLSCGSNRCGKWKEGFKYLG
jgi:hypothetical protein